MKTVHSSLSSALCNILAPDILQTSTLYVRSGRIVNLHLYD